MKCPHPSHTPAVAVVLVFAPGLERPYPLIPSEDYRYCDQCDAVFTFVEKAIAAHASTRADAVGPATRAVVLFDDGDSQNVELGEFVGLA